MFEGVDDLRTAWHAQPTTLFRLTPQEMRTALERIDRRQRRIARGFVAAFVGEVIAFATILFLINNPLVSAGCIWIMIAMGWFAHRLWTGLRRAERASEDMLARPSIDAFRSSLEARWEFYRLLPSFGAILPGVALILIASLVRQPDSAPIAALVVAVFIAATANGFRLHLPHARAIRQQITELDRL
jgi:hypothetical protein